MTDYFKKAPAGSKPAATARKASASQKVPESKGKAPVKRAPAKKVVVDSSDDDADVVVKSSPPPAPRQTAPKRAARGKAKAYIELTDGDDDDGGNGDGDDSFEI